MTGEAVHELSIAKGIIELVADEKRARGFERVLSISLCVGEYSGVVPECLREFFPYAAQGTPAEGAALSFTPLKAEFTCGDCAYSGGVDRRAARCPRCGGAALKMTRGREFYIESLTVE